VLLADGRSHSAELAPRLCHDSTLYDINAVRKVTRKKKYFAQKLLEWSKTTGVSYPWRQTDNPYDVLVSEFLLRKTRADKASEVYTKLLNKYPSLGDLNKADTDEIRSVVNSLGLGKTRSIWMKNCLKKICERFGNRISSEDRIYQALDKNQKYLRSALQCFAYDENCAILDVNVSRVIERMFSIDLGKEPHKRTFAWVLASILVPEKFYKEYNWALLDLGRLICKARKPACDICPLRKSCEYARGHRKQPAD